MKRYNNTALFSCSVEILQTWMYHSNISQSTRTDTVNSVIHSSNNSIGLQLSA